MNSIISSSSSTTTTSSSLLLQQQQQQQQQQMKKKIIIRRKKGKKKGTTKNSSSFFNYSNLLQHDSNEFTWIMKFWIPIILFLVVLAYTIVSCIIYTTIEQMNDTTNMDFIIERQQQQATKKQQQIIWSSSRGYYSTNNNNNNQNYNYNFLRRAGQYMYDQNNNNNNNNNNPYYWEPEPPRIESLRYQYELQQKRKNMLLFNQNNKDRRSSNNNNNNYNENENDYIKNKKIMMEKYEQERIRTLIKKLRYSKEINTFISDDDDDEDNYDIKQCPNTIPINYPKVYNIIDVLTNWNPDNMTIPNKIYQGLCWFDWTKINNNQEQRKVIEYYRNSEVPFLIKNHPETIKASIRWSNFNYISKLVNGNITKYRNEYAKNNNHLMYWKTTQDKIIPKNWKPPTENIELTFNEWYNKSIQIENIISTTNNNNTTQQQQINTIDHYYLRLNSYWNQIYKDFMYDELTIFKPTSNNFFIVDKRDARGLNCRFGSKGIIAELHYDMSRNFITILGGYKRYILAHPSQCKNLQLYPIEHPSGRHSRVNWSNPNEYYKYTTFHQSLVNEVILQPGDILYLPTNWFHFIVSLNLNYQCNARSGITFETQHYIRECGF